MQSRSLYVFYRHLRLNFKISNLKFENYFNFCFDASLNEFSWLNKVSLNQLEVLRSKKAQSYSDHQSEKLQKVIEGIWYYIPTSPVRAGYDTRLILSGVLQVWIQSFPSPRLVTSPRLKHTVCPNYIPIAGGGIIGFIPFPRVLVLLWNAISLVQDLNSCHRVHFPRR